jgi:hypothetical protein
MYMHDQKKIFIKCTRNFKIGIYRGRDGRHWMRAVAVITAELERLAFGRRVLRDQEGPRVKTSQPI